ncbi:MAG: SDR family oxidoreductase [Ardenticatenales bacterium]|nr:SDR family oxidoreductase [Ardenticatenales bacterium]
MKDTILVTGAGTGLGLEMSLYLAEKGFNVYATIPFAEQQAHIEEQAARRHVSPRVLLLDVTEPNSIAAAVETILAESGGIFGAINNAGISLRGYFEDCDDQEIRRVYDINVFGAMNVTRAVLPHMRAAKRGRLLYITSIGGRIASMARTAYCSSKFALEGFAESLYQEVTPLGIHVSAIAPAIVKNERWTVHRGLAKRAQDPQSPYFTWFQREEEMADRLVESSPTTNVDVALTAYHALTAAHPKLHYIVGRRATLAVRLRELMPGNSFERLILGRAIKQVTQE